MKCKRVYQEGGSTTPKTPKWGSYIGVGTTLLPGIIDLFTETPAEKNITEMGDNYIEEANNIANTPFGGSNATLLEQSKNLPVWQNLDIDDFGGETNSGGAFLQGLASGASAGAMTGNPLIAAGAGIINGFISGLNAENSNKRKRAQVARANQAGQAAANRARDNFNAAVAATDTLNDRWRLQNMYNTNYAAFGGLLETNGADWKTGASFIDNGGTHQENPFGGVQFGIASDGMPNLVEEGEVVIKVRNNPNQGHSFADGGSSTYDDYVVSNREFPTLEEIANANITKTPEKYVGMSWAAIYKDIFDKSHIKEVINRQDSKDYIDVLNERVAQAHEITRLRNQQEAIMNRLKKATPEEQDLILQQAGYPNLLEEAAYAAHGGKIYIKPSKRGTFTAAAKKRGMGVQEFASKVLANKEDYSPAMVKKANFARNASKWHQWGGWANQDELNDYYAQQYTDFWNNLQGRKGSNVNRAYLTGAQARQWVNQLSQGDEQQQALANMLKNQWGDNLDWSDTATWEFKNKYNPKGSVTESTPYLQWAGDNTAMKDALWGIRHIPQLSVDNRYQQGNYTPSTPEIILPAGPQSINRYWTYDWNTGERTPITEAEFNNPDEGWFMDDTLTEYGPDSEDDINAYRDLYLTNRTSSTSNTDIETPSQKGEGITDYDWILPAVSGANLIADLAGWTNVADYSNANRVGRAILPPRYIGYNPNGRYAKPQLVDTNYLAARLANQSMAGINAAKDLSGANRATALANIAAQNYLGQQATGEAIAQSQIANNKAIQDAVQINNAVDRANAEGALQADRANQAAWDNYVSRYAAQKTAEAKLREDIDTQVAANRSANWNNFLENLQGYFDNQRNRNMANLQYAWSGYQYKDKNGKVHLQYETPEEKSEAERFIKRQPKSKRDNYIVESV